VLVIGKKVIIYNESLFIQYSFGVRRLSGGVSGLFFPFTDHYPPLTVSSVGR
jgi:hypothetical protein